MLKLADGRRSPKYHRWSRRQDNFCRPEPQVFDWNSKRHEVTFDAHVDSWRGFYWQVFLLYVFWCMGFDSCRFTIQSPRMSLLEVEAKKAGKIRLTPGVGGDADNLNQKTVYIYDPCICLRSFCCFQRQKVCQFFLASAAKGLKSKSCNHVGLLFQTDSKDASEFPSHLAEDHSSQFSSE